MITMLNDKAITAEVPEGTRGYSLWGNSDTSPQLGYEYIQKNLIEKEFGGSTKYINLPPGPWSILGRPEKIKEEQWKQITPRMDGDLAWIPSYNDPDSGGHGYCYEDFENEDEHAVYYTASESGLSLLRSKNIPKDSVIILIKHQ